MEQLLIKALENPWFVGGFVFVCLGVLYLTLTTPVWPDDYP